MSGKKVGRPKKKFGKKVTFNLSYDSINKLNTMTQLGRNASAFIEMIIDSHYRKTMEQKKLNGENKREGLDKSKF